MIEAKIIADSIGPAGVRLTTFVLKYPRFIHSEFMTHRMFSRNASSSRAIPVKKQIQEVLDNPAIPLSFLRNQKGMQGGEVLDKAAHDQALTAWLKARDLAVSQAQVLADLEVHKQYANRILEPFSHISVVCSATDYDNFFALRRHSAAQPEIHALADEMWARYQTHTPKVLNWGEIHLPFADPAENPGLTDEELLFKSVAACARVSYNNHDGTAATPEQDKALFDRLLDSVPIHASPAEHQAMAMSETFRDTYIGNFRGWHQFRKSLGSKENIKEYHGED